MSSLSFRLMLSFKHVYLATVGIVVERFVTVAVFAQLGGIDGDSAQIGTAIVFVFHFISINYVLNGRKVKP